MVSSPSTLSNDKWVEQLSNEEKPPLISSQHSFLLGSTLVTQQYVLCFEIHLHIMSIRNLQRCKPLCDSIDSLAW